MFQHEGLIKTPMSIFYTIHFFINTIYFVVYQDSNSQSNGEITIHLIFSIIIIQKPVLLTGPDSNKSNTCLINERRERDGARGKRGRQDARTQRVLRGRLCRVDLGFLPTPAGELPINNV